MEFYIMQRTYREFLVNIDKWIMGSGTLNKIATHMKNFGSP